MVIKFRGHPSKTSSRKGGEGVCVCQCGRPRSSELQYIFCVSDSFLRFYALYDPDVWTFGLEMGCLSNGRIGQGGGVSKKYVFARTSLMDDPLSVFLPAKSYFILYAHLYSVGGYN